MSVAPAFSYSSSLNIREKLGSLGERSTRTLYPASSSFFAVVGVSADLCSKGFASARACSVGKLMVMARRLLRGRRRVCEANCCDWACICIQLAIRDASGDRSGVINAEQAIMTLKLLCAVTKTPGPKAANAVRASRGGNRSCP
jgi:hypothetical protein